MLPIVSPLHKPNAVLKSIPLRLGPSEPTMAPPENKSSLIEEIPAESPHDCTHVVTQTSRTLLRFSKIARDPRGSQLRLEPSGSLPIYSRIFYMSKISEQQQDYVFMVCEDLSLSLVGLDTADSGEVKILSYMPLDNLDPSVVSLIRLERHVTHFVYHPGASISRAILTFEGSDWLMIVRFRTGESGQLEIVDFELDQIEGLKDAIDISSCSATEMRGWPDESCLWLLFTMAQPLAPFDFSRDVMLSKNYEHQSAKLKAKRRTIEEQIEANERERLERDLDPDEVVSYDKKLSELMTQRDQIAVQLKDLKAEFEDVASDDEGHTFAQAVDQGEQQVLKVYRYGSPNLEEQQELQIELLQTSSFILDFMKIFPSSQLFVKFISLKASKPSAANVSHVILLSTSEGLCYLDILQQTYELVQVEGGQTQSGLIQTDILPLKQPAGSGEVICILKSENVLQNSTEQWIDTFDGYQMAVIDLKGKDQVDQTPLLQIFRVNQEVLNNISDISGFTLISQSDHEQLYVNQQLTNILRMAQKGGDQLPVLSLVDSRQGSGDSALGLDSEVMDLQTGAANTLIYHNAHTICMRSFQSTFTPDAAIRFEKDDGFFENLRLVELTDKFAIMLANQFGSTGSSISLFVGQRWEPSSMSPFQFQHVDQAKAAAVLGALEDGTEKEVFAWLEGQLQKVSQEQAAESKEDALDLQSGLVDFYSANQCVVLVTSKGIGIKNYRTGVENQHSFSMNILRAKTSEESIAVLDETNVIHFVSLAFMSSPIPQQAFPRPQAIRLSPDEQVHDFCVSGSIVAVILFNSPIVRFFDGVDFQFELDLTSLVPFDASQVQPDAIDFVALQGSSQQEAHFMTITLTNGSLISFSFNPSILAKLSLIQNQSEKAQILSQSLVKFAGIDKVGDFIKSQIGTIFVNESNEIFEAVLDSDETRQSLKLQSVACELTKKPSVSPFGVTVIENEIVAAVQAHRAFSSKPNLALLIREGATNQLVLQVGHIQSRESKSRRISAPPKYKIQKVKVVEKLNLVAVCCFRDPPESLKLSTYSSGTLDLNAEFDNKILLLNSGTGEELSDPKRMPQSQIPQHIEYLEREEIVLVGTNSIVDEDIALREGERRPITCAVRGYHLFNKDGILGLHDALALKFRQGSIMDMKQFTWFDGSTHLAVAINNFIQIYRVNVLELEEKKRVKLVPVLKIESQIGVYKIQIKMFEQRSNKFMEILVADVLKSLIVYQIDYDEPFNSEEAPDQSPFLSRSASFTEKIANGIQTRLMRRKSQLHAEENRYSTLEVAWKKERVKYKFPFGQWCTGAERINEHDTEPRTKNLYVASFFDQNFVVIQGNKLQREQIEHFDGRLRREQYLSIVAASNLGDQVTSMVKPVTGLGRGPGEKKTGVPLDDPSLIFISTPYLQNYQLPTKLQSSFFDVSSKFVHTMHQANQILSNENPSLVFSMASGGLQVCRFCGDPYLSDVLTATQEALSDLLNLEALLTRHALSQLQARLEDKIAFNQKFSSYQDGGGILSQSIDLNVLLASKKENKEDALITKSTATPDKESHGGGDIQNLDLKKSTFLSSMRANVHGLEDMNCRPIVFVEFLQNLLHLSYEDQEKITFKVREALLEREKGGLKAARESGGSVNIEVRELVGLVAALAHQL